MILNGETETIFNAVNYIYIKESSKHFLQGTEEEYDKFIIKVVCIIMANFGEEFQYCGRFFFSMV